MKFGTLDKVDLEVLDWTLPNDHKDTAEILERLDPKHHKTNFYCGCAKWNMKSWIGIHYPETTKEKDFIQEYIKLFNSIELNSTFYRLSRTSIQKWKDEVGDSEFTFCPKWSRRVSHLKRLKDVDENIEYFIESCKLFGNVLGPSFLQMPENFSPKYMDRLQHFFDKVPQEFKVHLELRHPDWFIGPVFDEICTLLKSKNHGLVITDVAGRRDVLHQRLTTDSVMIRFNGYGPLEVDNKRLEKWNEVLLKWKGKGIKSIYFFFHHADDTLAPFNSKYLMQLFNS